MAFDGFAISALRAELDDNICGGRITKIVQPESDELLITIKNGAEQHRLLLSASASLPLAYLTKTNRPAPMTAPGFCMLLRKHIGGGRIISVTQPGLERILRFEIEHLDEMGDLCRKYLIIELMGKHSNIIFCRDDGTILDSIKHVSSAMSSVREVLPGRTYFIPKTQEKLDPTSAPVPEMISAVCAKPMPLSKAVYTTLTGFSPVIAEELCHRAGADSTRPGSALDACRGSFCENDASAATYFTGTKKRLSEELCKMITDLREMRFSPTVYYDGKEPVEFSAVELTMYADLEARSHESMSELLESYYSEKNKLSRIRQKSSDLRRIVTTLLERERKKYDLQKRQLRDTEKKDTYRILGELIEAYGYGVPEGASSMKALNYYTNEEVEIPLDPNLPALDNAKKYFERYAKLKRTNEAVSKLLVETEAEIKHLESIRNAIDMARAEEDLAPIREELAEYGYIRRKGGGKKVKITSKPYHYVSSDGFDIYVGKNNYQNDELTFHFASNSDWWFHAKGIPGSHVVLKTKGRDLPDRAFEEAARLAAYYSGGRGGDRVEVDYVEKRHVKKPGGARPGFVVYYTNYSMVIDSDISGLKQAD